MEKYILVKGDVSGIQDFIFNVKSKGAAQELKGRSFFIKLLIEVAMRYLFDNSSIPADNRDDLKISTSGGNFIIKLPIDKKDVVDGAQKIFDNALQYTELSISFAYSDYNKDYAKSIQNLNTETRKQKLKFYHSNIDFYKPTKRDKYKLNVWSNITNNLKNTNFSISKNNNYNQILGNKLEFAGYRINFNSHQGDDNKLVDFIESLLPLYNGRIKQFENLASYGGERGVDKLGVLTMDVDGLGNKIETIRDEKAHSDFDNKLQFFFNIKIRGLINSKYKDNIYVVTAGGDDSFFVGKWNTMVDLALDIKKEFINEFGEFGLTISAGLIIIDSKFPVVRFAQMAENALKKAKYDFDEKGNINLFGEVIKWEILEDEIIPLRKYFTRALKGKFTKGKLQKARSLLYNNIDRAIQLQDFWQLNYYLRDLSSKGNLKKNLLDIIDKSMKNAVRAKNNFDKRNYRLIIPIAARLAELDKR